ncbi:MAG: hypothetical protein ACRC3B_09545 [Bacteroidia bacterium]
MKVSVVLSVVAATILTFAACKKDNNTGRLQARLMDAPIAGNVQEVNVEITGEKLI